MLTHPRGVDDGRDRSHALQSWLRGAAPRLPGALAASAVESGVVATAVIGAGPNDDFELGSISKAVTGLLYADAVSSGVVQPDTRLGALLDVGDGPIGVIPLSDLATHRSGLPRLPAGMHTARRTWDLLAHGTNPYGDTLEVLLAQARMTPVGRRRFRYSNLGFELLGHAVASARAVPYADLLRTRLTQPLGMSGTYAPGRVEDLSPRAVPGFARRGRPRDPWTGEALAPAGGVRSTITDSAALLGSLLDGTAPGCTALEPVIRAAGPARIGAAWMTVERRGRPLTWHNGRTGGFASWIGLDRERGAGVVVLSATSRSVDGLGVRLLDWWEATQTS